jgi:sec-independent protein translocase protein TatA
MFGLGPMEMMIVGVIAVLLFGNKLPEVGRSLGRSLVEFKKGMTGIQDEIETASSGSSSSSSRSSASTAKYNEIDDRDEATAPKFDPPSAEPTESKDSQATA